MTIQLDINNNEDAQIKQPLDELKLRNFNSKALTSRNGYLCVNVMGSIFVILKLAFEAVRNSEASQQNARSLIDAMPLHGSNKQAKAITTTTTEPYTWIKS